MSCLNADGGMARSRYYSTAHWRRLRALCYQRDHWRCSVPGCGSREDLTADHIVTRPNVDHPTEADSLSNLRTLCGRHDRQIKERPGGTRRGNRGQLRVVGCDADGLPVDPSHPWAQE